MDQTPDVPLVSVLCICGDHGRFVGDCLRSLDAQTWPNLEVLLLDNASKDDSAAVIGAWAAATGRRHEVLRQEEPAGVCRNFNELFGRATGEYFFLLAADDLLLPEKIERQVRLLQAAPVEAAVVYSDATQIDECGNPLPGLFVASNRQRDDCPDGEVLGELLKGNWIPAHGALVRRAAWAECGPWDETLVYEDWDMWLRLAARYRFLHDPVPSAVYRIVATSLSRAVLKRSTPSTRWSVATIKGRAASFPNIPVWERCRLLAGALEEIVALGATDWPSAEMLVRLFDLSTEPSLLAAARGDGVTDAPMLAARAAELRRLESQLRAGGKALEARRTEAKAPKRAEQSPVAPGRPAVSRLARLWRALRRPATGHDRGGNGRDPG
jgi:glycosyltransferase involved in cell wall biosynthesis